LPCKKKGGGYIEINHDPTPVNEFFNPMLFPMIYPTLFPYGIGGFENEKRSSRLSLKHHAKHFFSLADRHFQEHYSFLFTVFNILQRREILLHTSLKVKRHKFSSVAQSFASVSAEAVHVVSERVAQGDSKTFHSKEEQQVLNLMKEVNVITSHVPGSAAARVVMRNEIRALMILEKGLPSFYITINPADVYNPLVKFLAGAEIDIDKLLPEEIPNYWEQSLLIAKNPAVAARFFNIYMRAFITTILAYDKKKVKNGIFGIVNAYYGCVEAQGRGTLHCHMLVWVEGGLNPNQIKERVLNDGHVDFRDRLLAFLDDTISNCVPTNPYTDHRDSSSKPPHPCSIRGIDINENCNKNATKENKHLRQYDLHRLVKQCQLHVQC
jgi:Helitron helicase-like domain at N-terminus